MATFAQCHYLQALAEKCQERGIELPEEVKDQLWDKENLSNEEAAELIDTLKFELGWK